MEHDNISKASNKDEIVFHYRTKQKENGSRLSFVTHLQIR